MLQETKLANSGHEAVAHSAEMSPAPRLLVIDDDNLHRMVICRVAVKAGFVAAGAASYDEAAKSVQQNAFDCISLDLSLGEHAGVEVLRHLWIIGCKAPIIIITGCDDATCSEALKVAESLKLNIFEAIAKPVNLAVLRASLERLRTPREAAADEPQPLPQISPA
jgi:DNA-binding response OmpR family regulator